MSEMATRGRSFGFLLTLAALATGCGGDDGGGGGGGGTGGGGSIDACSIVTQADASALFGQPAEKDASGSPNVPGMAGECLWSWSDASANSHLLQFRVWNGEAYYSPGANAEPFAIGDKGAVSTDPTWGVDVTWLKGDTVGTLAYSTVGNVPDATTKVEAVKTLALSAAAKMP